MDQVWTEILRFINTLVSPDWGSLVALIPLTRLPSPTVTIGAGFLAGGALGNLIAGASDHLAVPNPLLLHTSSSGGIAFNFADAFILTGNLILVLSLCALVIKNRRQLQHKRGLAHILRRED